MWRKAFLSHAHFFNALFCGQQIRMAFHIVPRSSTLVASLCDALGPCVTRRGRIVFPHGHRASTCTNATSACGSQKVISIARYSAMAADSAARASSRWPVAAYNVPRPR